MVTQVDLNLASMQKGFDSSLEEKFYQMEPMTPEK
jgi:hypothetical protein